MEITKEIKRTLKIKVVDTNRDHIKIMYSKFDDQDDFTWAYVFVTNIKKIVKKMKTPSISPVAFFQVDGKSKEYRTNNIVAIRNDIDNYVLLNYFQSHMEGYEEYRWEPKTFGEEFPENHSMYFALSYNHTMYDIDGNLLGKIYSDFVTQRYWNLDELEKFESEVDWFSLKESGWSGDKRYYVPGNGYTVVPEIELTSEEHDMIKEVPCYNQLATIFKHRLGDDISRFYNPNKPEMMIFD